MVEFIQLTVCLRHCQLLFRPQDCCAVFLSLYSFWSCPAPSNSSRIQMYSPSLQFGCPEAQAKAVARARRFGQDQVFPLIPSKRGPIDSFFGASVMILTGYGCSTDRLRRTHNDGAFAETAIRNARSTTWYHAIRAPNAGRPAASW